MPDLAGQRAAAWSFAETGSGLTAAAQDRIDCSVMKQFFDSTGKGTVPSVPYVYCPRCGVALGGKRGATCPECGFVHYRNPLPGVSVLVANRSGELLVGRRAIEPQGWCLPCGYIEWDENFLQAAHREVEEETGLRIRIRSVVNVVSNYIAPSLESIVVVLIGEVVAGKAVAGDDIAELAWIRSETDRQMAFDSDRYVIAEYFGGSLSEIPVDPRFAEWR